MKIDRSQWYEVARGNQVDTKDTPIMCRNVSPRSLWQAQELVALHHHKCRVRAQKKTTTPCAPGDDRDNVQRRKALVKLWHDESWLGWGDL